MSQFDQPLDPRTLRSQRAAALTRRHFLRGMGASIALPAFASLAGKWSSPLLAAAPSGPAGALATTSTGAPLRLAFVYVPNGAIADAWWPQGEPGGNYELNRTMQPLAELKSQFQILGGLDCHAADPGQDGGGDHARAGGSFLTACRTRKSNTHLQTGVSIDQVVAQQVGHLTPFRSIELSCDPVHTTGSCDSGYACAYSYNLSWRTPSCPVAPEPNPRLLFERMFGSGPPEKRHANLQRRLAGQKSILDFVLDDAQRIDRTLNARDRHKLDEYLTGLRDIEQRISVAEAHQESVGDPGGQAPTGIPQHFPDYLSLMYDMLFLAFQTDQTRVATFMPAHEGSNRTMPFLGVAEGHHNCSHHNQREEMIEKVRIIDHFYLQQFARFIGRLQETIDVDGHSLLHNSMICYGSGISDGNKHLHTDLPLILAGNGGGTLRPGRYVRFQPQSIANLYLSLSDRMGCQGVEAHGDSTDRADGV